MIDFAYQRLCSCGWENSRIRTTCRNCGATIPKEPPMKTPLDTLIQDHEFLHRSAETGQLKMISAAYEAFHRYAPTLAHEDLAIVAWIKNVVASNTLGIGDIDRLIQVELKAREVLKISPVRHDAHYVIGNVVGQLKTVYAVLENENNHDTAEVLRMAMAKLEALTSVDEPKKR